MGSLSASVLTLGLALALGGCATAPASVEGPSSATRPPAYGTKHLPKPEHLRDDVRAAISDSMQGHGDDMTLLLWSLVFLDSASSAEFATAIADRPPLANPKPGGPRPPPQIVNLAAQLSERARQLAVLAQAPEKDRAAISRAFGEVTETCVNCHAAYLYDR